MYRSRLQRTEEKKNLKLAMWIVVGLMVFVGFAAFAGFPLLIRFAVLIGDLNSSRDPVVRTDIIPPAPPRLGAPFTATNSAVMQIFGTTEAGARIYLSKNNDPFTNTVADDKGVFRFNDVKLDFGTNEFTAVAMDTSGNSSQPSEGLRIQFSDKEPNLTVDSPTNNQEFRGKNNKIIDFKGKTDPGVQLIVNDRVVLVRSDGTFSTKIELSDGDTTLKITAIDKAGNSLNRELQVRYVDS